MTVSDHKVQEILDILRSLYPGWDGFSHPAFVKDEIAYKQNTIAKARELLNESEWQRLLQAGQADEIIRRLEVLGHDNNLLWLSVPLSGDLAILYQPNLDRTTFCTAMFDLLHGPGPSPERLDRYLAYVIDQGLPNRWTFPTYFLFICHPDSEMFIKPTPVKQFLELVQSSIRYDSTPKADIYRDILQLVADVRTAFAPYGPRDNVDIQGLIWACYQHARAQGREWLSIDKREEFAQLFAEFLASYPDTVDGQAHMALYPSVRQAGLANWQTITAAASAGHDVTDAVLLKLLPYANTPANRSQGAWTHWAPAINGDIRRWYESAGWTRSEDWPQVAAAIVSFVQRSVADPGQIAATVADFTALPVSRGFQSGILSPILNALRPEAFAMINNKSREVVNYFSHQSYSQRLTDYPALNQVTQQLVSEVSELMRLPGAPELADGDLFDMFSHWLVAVKHHSFRSARGWKIAPGDQAWQWEACQQGGFIAIGWDELGDLSGVSRAEYVQRRDALRATHGWTINAVDQAWTFVSRIKEGDRIMANRGTREVVGVGTVTGSYYFVPGERHGHRLPVTWDDTTVRAVDEPGWRRTLIELEPGHLEAILQAPAAIDQATPHLAAPFASIFNTWAEADWAFDLFADVARRLGVTGPADPRVSFTYGVNQRRKVLRLNFGNWMVTDVARSDSAEGLHLRMALLADAFEPLGLTAPRFDAFTQKAGAPEVRVYELPASLLIDMPDGLRGVYEASLAYIAGVFAHWKAGVWRFAHQQEIFDAVFDPIQRQRLFTAGLAAPAVSTVDDLELSVGEAQPVYAAGSVHSDAAFSPRAFELLAGIHANPTRQFYQGHKDEFRTEIEEPFARLLHAVAQQLPASVREVMETEKRVVSRFLKNDWGRGGAWDFYWGAFYPKGSKRTEGAQLIVLIRPERLEFGFYIGDYGSEQQRRFQRNLQTYQRFFQQLEHTIVDGSYILGDRTNYQVDAEGHIIAEVPHTWQDFLRDPAQLENDISRILPRQQALQMPASDLAAQIAQGFAQLFPLVLHAIYDDPMPAVAEYLEEPESRDEEEPDLRPDDPLAQVADDTGFGLPVLADWVRAIQRKGQAILYGPPGTGKTFMAERLASHLIGGGDGFSELVQFHPAYAYEDFIQGIRPQPQEGGGLTYAVVPGRFLDFCRRAEKCRGTCVLIIDEINRANLARVFGELMYLLEYREKEIPLSGGGRLRIPANVRVIGTMNTADRSIALVDHALRRRFAFLPLYPQYDVLRRHQAQANPAFPVDSLIAVLQHLNRTINDRHYEVGISFFLRADLPLELPAIWAMEIEPYLEEYFFDQHDKVDEFRWDKVQKRIVP